ncbi:hypothetical protein [Mucilaginibacter sp.]
MNIWDKSSFVKDLSDFLALIAEIDPPIDVSKIYNFQAKFEYSKDYSINIEDIVFNVNSKTGGTIPNEVENLSIYWDHICELDQDKNSESHDLINKGYLFRLKLVGRDKSKKEYVNWWRLDKDEEGAKEHKTTHPYYHFQSGGDELIGTNTGDNLFMGAPRLAHPPMDLFLGFHFIINNFYNKKQYPFVKTILDNEVYQEIIDRAQKRYWLPYFNSFNGTSKHANFNLVKVFPLYMVIN